MRIAALDIGGTKIKFAGFEGNTDLRIQEMDTPCAGPDLLLDSLERAVTSLGSANAIGVCTRGQVSREGAILFDNGPIRDYTGTELKRELEARLSLPVFVENDANAAAWGEARLGAGRGAEHLACVTFGTGIGGGMVIGGKLFRGAHCSAGEFGAMQLFSQNPLPLGKNGAFYENTASASALVESVRKHFPDISDGRQLCSRLDEAPIFALVDRWAEKAALGISSLVHLLDPEKVILGGGIMQNQTVFSLVEKHTRAQLMHGFERVCLCPAQLGNRAGLIGAALLAEEML